MKSETRMSKSEGNSNAEISKFETGARARGFDISYSKFGFVSNFDIRYSNFRPAFTLVELMISIALILLLMLGINQVFKVTGEAAGTSQALSTGLRDARAAQVAMGADFAAMASDSPAIIIRSERVSAFRNRQDELSDRDWDRSNPTENAKRSIDLDGDGIEGENNVPGEAVIPALYGTRSHRVDRMCFFARGLFPRQTGGGIDASGSLIDEYVADMTTREAWMWYGHLKRPDERSPLNTQQAFEHRNPGENPNLSLGDFNDRNFYASDFVLGRMAMLLNEGVDLNSDGVGDEIRDKNNVLQRFIRRNGSTDPLPAPSPAQRNLKPLVQLVESNEPNAADRWDIQWSRYDLVNTSINQYRTILTDWLAPGANPPGTYAATSASAWFNQLADWRFQGDPIPLKPLTADNVARTAPAFLEHCSQFIVEYAGDFVEQSQGITTPPFMPAGQVVDVDGDGNVYGADGYIDFIAINPDTANEQRHIRWYGMPRDVSGPNGVPDGVIISSFSVAANSNALVDVVPLLDVLETAVGGFTVPPPPYEFIERVLPRPIPAYPFSPPRPTYANINNPSAPGMVADAKYIVAWGPDTPGQPRPQLIRIVYTIDDPTGRLAEGQTFEYVFRVGG